MVTAAAAMALPRPSVAGNRPAYLDNLFRDAPSNETPSVRSAHSSISSSASSADLRTLHATRPLSPAFEEEDQDDKSSIRSLRLQFSPRRSFRNLIHRRTYPQVEEMLDVASPRCKPLPPGAPLPRERQMASRGGVPRRPSLPKLQTAPAPPRAQALLYASKPLPAAPSLRAREMKCQPCYYFAARNCNGYVFDGGHGDACENCLAAGFFGAS